MDSSIVTSLNHWFAGSDTKIEIVKFLTLWPLIGVLALAVWAWLSDWGRVNERRAALALGVGGAVLALVINKAVGHFYIRPRPFTVASLGVTQLVSHSKDTGFFSDHLCVAGALTAALLEGWRKYGIAALALSLLLAIGRIGAGLHYPSDVLVGFVVGALAFAVLLPFRTLSWKAVSLVSKVENNAVPRSPEGGGPVKPSSGRPA